MAMLNYTILLRQGFQHLQVRLNSQPCFSYMLGLDEMRRMSHFGSLTGIIVDLSKVDDDQIDILRVLLTSFNFGGKIRIPDNSQKVYGYEKALVCNSNKPMLAFTMASFGRFFVDYGKRRTTVVGDLIKEGIDPRISLVMAHFFVIQGVDTYGLAGAGAHGLIRPTEAGLGTASVFCKSLRSMLDSSAPFGEIYNHIGISKYLYGEDDGLLYNRYNGLTRQVGTFDRNSVDLKTLVFEAKKLQKEVLGNDS